MSGVVPFIEAGLLPAAIAWAAVSLGAFLVISALYDGDDW